MCLVSGVDALYLSGRATVSPTVGDRLETVRSAAVETDAPMPFVVGEHAFGLYPRSFGRYRYRLSHPYGLLGVTTSEHLPALRVQIRADFIHAVGPDAALSFFEEVACGLVEGPVRWGLSRLDLFCDVQGWAPAGDDRHQFVCRAKRLHTHEEGDALTGFEFGRRTTKTICARIYDKTRQVADEGIDYWPSVWGERFDPGYPVWRVEAELGREGLKQFGVFTPREGLRLAPRLWASVTETWLSHRVETGDATKSRWPVSSEWTVVQQAPLRGAAIGLDRVRAGKRRGELRRMLPQLVGYLASAGAAIGVDDLPSTLGAVRALVSEDELDRGVRFSERVAARQAERVYG